MLPQNICRVNVENTNNHDLSVDYHIHGDCIVIVDYQNDCVEMSRGSAIAAARAILKHYNEGLDA